MRNWVNNPDWRVVMTNYECKKSIYDISTSRINSDFILIYIWKYSWSNSIVEWADVKAFVSIFFFFCLIFSHLSFCRYHKKREREWERTLRVFKFLKYHRASVNISFRFQNVFPKVVRFVRMGLDFTEFNSAVENENLIL